MAFFIQPVSNNFQLRFYGFALSLLFSHFALCVTATLAHPHPHSLFISYSLSLPFLLFLFHSSLVLCVLTLPSLVLYSSPFLYFFLPFSSLPSSHIFSFSFMASCSGLGNEGSVIKYGRCLGAGSQPVYQRTKNWNWTRMETEGGRLAD